MKTFNISQNNNLSQKKFDFFKPKLRYLRKFQFLSTISMFDNNFESKLFGLPRFLFVKETLKNIKKNQRLFSTSPFWFFHIWHIRFSH